MISSPLLSRFDFNNRSVTLVTNKNYVELFPAMQLKIIQSVIVARGTRQIGVDSGLLIMQSVIVARGTQQIGVDFGLLIKAPTWNILQH